MYDTYVRTLSCWTKSSPPLQSWMRVLQSLGRRGGGSVLGMTKPSWTSNARINLTLCRYASNGGSWFARHGDKLKQVTKEYGRVAIVFHSSVFAATLGSAYASIRMGVDIRHVQVPFINLEDINPDAGSFLLAYLVTLATGPLRGAITVVSTPWIARMLRKRF